jgi:hypothetical protein
MQKKTFMIPGKVTNMSLARKYVLTASMEDYNPAVETQSPQERRFSEKKLFEKEL